MEAEAQVTVGSKAGLLSAERLKEARFQSTHVELGDPMLAHMALPHHETYFPLGFPVTIATNSLDVLAAAQRSWGRFDQQFNTEPIVLQVGVSPTDSTVCPPTPACRMRGHFCMNVADSENFGVCDLSRGSATAWVTEAALLYEDYFRYFFLEYSAMSSISTRYTTAVHAGCVSIGGEAVLLCGDSGAGKSTLSYACARAGWNYITDDGCYLIHGRDDNLVVGNCHQVRFRPSASLLFPELQGLSVMQRAGVGKPSVELFTALDSNVRIANAAHVRHIVFLKRGVDKQDLALFPRALARLYMQRQVHCMPYLAEIQMDAIEQVLQVGTYELRYNDLEWAVDRLRVLVSEGQ